MCVCESEPNSQQLLCAGTAGVCLLEKSIINNDEREEGAGGSLTGAQCRACAGDPLQTGSGGGSAAPPSPPDASSHRSGPSGLLRRTAPWPCSSCSPSPESGTHTGWLLRQSPAGEMFHVYLQQNNDVWMSNHLVDSWFSLHVLQHVRILTSFLLVDDFNGHLNTQKHFKVVILETRIS